MGRIISSYVLFVQDELNSNRFWCKLSCMLEDDREEAYVNLFNSEHDIEVPSRRIMYFPHVMFIVLRYDCPYSCDHCFFFSNPNSKDILPDEALDKSLNFAAKMRMGSVMLTGGEPMLDPLRVFKAVERIKTLGIQPILQSSY